MEASRKEAKDLWWNLSLHQKVAPKAQKLEKKIKEAIKLLFKKNKRANLGNSKGYERASSFPQGIATE